MKAFFTAITFVGVREIFTRFFPFPTRKFAAERLTLICVCPD